MTINIGDIYETTTDEVWYKTFIITGSIGNNGYEVTCLIEGLHYSIVGAPRTSFDGHYLQSDQVHIIGNKDSLSRLERIIWGINE
jgi:hypothetical protein